MIPALPPGRKGEVESEELHTMGPPGPHRPLGWASPSLWEAVATCQPWLHGSGDATWNQCGWQPILSDSLLERDRQQPASFKAGKWGTTKPQGGHTIRNARFSGTGSSRMSGGYNACAQLANPSPGTRQHFPRQCRYSLQHHLDFKEYPTQITCILHKFYSTVPLQFFKAAILWFT